MILLLLVTHSNIKCQFSRIRFFKKNHLLNNLQYKGMVLIWKKIILIATGCHYLKDLKNGT